jgi:cytochrome b pre-mRNA-processing protein 3
MLLKRLFSRTPQTNPVRSVYEAIVALARQPVLYTDLAVPDTLDGRFDMIILHADAVVAHMQAGDDDDQEFAQNLIDEVFRDMDRSLREMGVGDMGVGKRVKKMATVYYGRADAYARARSQGDDDHLADAILRNVYAGNEVRAGKRHRAWPGYDRSLREAVADA